MIELIINMAEMRDFTEEIVEVPGTIFEIKRFNVQETVCRRTERKAKNDRNKISR